MNSWTFLKSKSDHVMYQGLLFATSIFSLSFSSMNQLYSLWIQFEVLCDDAQRFFIYAQWTLLDVPYFVLMSSNDLGSVQQSALNELEHGHTTTVPKEHEG